ncbi:MAG: hypothetical protein AABX93_01890 [Nanoarchaeota archaeon]
MGDNYIAIALGRDDSKNRIYGILFPFFEGIIDERFEEGVKAGFFDIRYKGPSLEEAKNSIGELKSVSRENLAEILREEVTKEIAKKPRLTD